MVNRPYKCPLCNSAFRNESGMQWHIAHRHQIPTAFDALGKEYEAKYTNLLDENAMLKKKVEQIETELQKSQMDLIQVQVEKTEQLVKVTELGEQLRKAAIALAARDSIIKERLNIEMPNPFE